MPSDLPDKSFRCGGPGHRASQCPTCAPQAVSSVYANGRDQLLWVLVSFVIGSSALTPSPSTELNMVDIHRSRLLPQGSGRPGSLRVGSSGFSVYLPAANFSDIKILHENLQPRKDCEDFNSNYLDHTKDEIRENGDPCLPFQFIGSFPLMETTQKVTSASGSDIKVYDRWTIALMFKECPGCCFMYTFLVYDSPLRRSPSLSSFGKDTGAAWTRATWICTWKSTSRSPVCNVHSTSSSRTLISDDCIMIPSYARSSTKRVLGRNTGDWEVFADQSVIRRDHTKPRRYLFVPNDRSFRKAPPQTAWQGREWQWCLRLGTRTRSSRANVIRNDFARFTSVKKTCGSGLPSSSSSSPQSPSRR